MLPLRESRRGTSGLRGFEASRLGGSQKQRELDAAVGVLVSEKFQEWPESEKYIQNVVGYIKMELKLYRIRQVGVKMMSDIALKSAKEATCSNNTHICDDV